MSGGGLRQAGILAAAALEVNATWVSFDRGFSRFKALRWLNPADL